LTDLFYALSGLPNYTTYYWRVNATNGGGTTAWATAWNFRTIIAAPVPASPANGATFVPNPTVFTWSAPTGATGYRLQIATDVGFLNIVHDDAALVAATATVGGLISGTTYFWRVLASHGAEVSAWSTIFFFSRGSQVILNVPYGKLILVSNGVSKWTILVP
jgi:titin